MSSKIDLILVDVGKNRKFRVFNHRLVYDRNKKHAEYRTDKKVPKVKNNITMAKNYYKHRTLYNRPSASSTRKWRIAYIIRQAIMTLINDNLKFQAMLFRLLAMPLKPTNNFKKRNVWNSILSL